MGHSLVFVLIPPGKPFSHKIQQDGFDIYGELWAYSEGPYRFDHEELLLTNPTPPEIVDDDIIRWRMTHRQVRLEFEQYRDKALKAELTPDMRLERLAELRNEHATFIRERYWIEDGYVCAESTANPNPRYDWFTLGGRWANDFADPPPWERPIVTEACRRCAGRGKLPGKRYLLPKFMRLTQEARADQGLPTTCPACEGRREFSGHAIVKDVPDEQMIKTVPEVMAVVEWSEHCWPWALVDLEGVWHGTEGGWGYGVPEEKDEREILENAVLRHLREAPEGTTVAVVDIHYAYG